MLEISKLEKESLLSAEYSLSKMQLGTFQFQQVRLSEFSNHCLNNLRTIFQFQQKVDSMSQNIEVAWHTVKITENCLEVSRLPTAAISYILHYPILLYLSACPLIKLLAYQSTKPNIYNCIPFVPLYHNF